MSYEQQDLETLENLQADFDTFLAKGEWTNARAVINNAGEMGFETEVAIMHKTFNRVYSEFDLTYEAIEQPVPPPLERGRMEPETNYFESSFATEWDEDGLSSFKK